MLDNNNYNNSCFYIDGLAESGKIFEYNTIYYLTKIRDKRVCTMAYAEIATTFWRKNSS